MIKNYAKEMLESLPVSTDPLTIMERNLLVYGNHVQLISVNDKYEVEIKDITKEWLSREGVL